MSLTKSALVPYTQIVLNILQEEERCLPWKVIIHFKGIKHLVAN